MKYAVLAAVTVVTAVCEFLYCSYMGVFESKFNIKKSEKYTSEELVPYSGIKIILIMIGCVAVAAAIQVLFIKNELPLNYYIKFYFLYVIVFAAAVIDSKMKLIPNILILSGLVVRVLIYVYEILKVEGFKDIIKSDLLGFAAGFGLLALISAITKQGIGFGDAKIFGLIGLFGGMPCTISTLFISVIVSAVASIIFLATRKKNKKGSFPFGPCIAAGYIVTMLLSNY
ncbi:MAG: A24 family peptidase [Clostridiales bacterium]|nr:A24 family peptidase [Clostridiales bacterium]